MKCITLAGKTALIALQQTTDILARQGQQDFADTLVSLPETLSKIKAILTHMQTYEARIRLYESLERKQNESASALKKAEISSLVQYIELLKHLIQTTPDLKDAYLEITMLPNNAFMRMGWTNFEGMISFYGEIDAYASIAQQS